MTTLLCDKYVLLDRIGSGGMAEIFLAKHVGISGFEKLVVIKRILPQYAKKHLYVQMFLDEAKIAADLRHPNIVSTIEVTKDQDVYFMVMEYLHGLDLRFIFRKMLSSNQAIPLELSVSVAIEVLAGLHYAHNKRSLNGQSLGIVHRDISPQNIVLTFEGETKIVDFGIAHARIHKKEGPGVLRGKFAYMSPEQAQGREVDHRSDQLSLAIVLYELTTGKRLFKRESEAKTILSAASCEVQPPSGFIPSYPKPLETILLRALSKNPDERFMNCEEFGQELQGFLHKQRSAFGRSELGKFLRQHFGSYDKPNLDLSGTYFCRNTNSEFSGRKQTPKTKKSKTPRRLIAALVITMSCCFAGGAFFICWPRLTSHVKASNDPPKEPKEYLQSVGFPDPIENGADKVMTEPEKKKGYGRLKIVVEPWGEIYVDGKRIGMTPLAPRKILEGKHTVRIVNSKLAKEKTMQVEIHAQKDALVRYQF